MKDDIALLERAVKRRFGNDACLENIELATLGASNQSILFDLVENQNRRRLVSRRETYSDPDSPFLDSATQYRIMEVAHRHGIPVPEPVFAFDDQDELGEGFICTFVQGETMPKKIQQACMAQNNGQDIVRQLATTMAKLHAIPAVEFDFLSNVPDSIDPLAAKVARYDRYGQIKPALEYAFRWLEKNKPDNSAEVLVHGDLRLGNFMVHDQQLSSLLDWECTHLGQAAEDIGWLCTRSWRFDHPDLRVAGLGDLPTFLDVYRDVSGIAIDEDVVRYWEIFGLTNWAVINIMQADGHLNGGRRSAAFAACGRNSTLIEYDLMMTLTGKYQ